MAMQGHGLHPHLAWGPVHRASFGLIYGSILVLSLLMAMDEVRDGPLEACPGALRIGAGGDAGQDVR
jgi:hypothetical protein